MMTADGDEDNEGIVAFDDDELADMFSFGIEASESMISTELENNDEYKRMMQNITPATVTDDDDSNYSDDSLIQYMEQNKDATVFDPVAAVTQQSEGEIDEEKKEFELVDMQDILDWLDNDEELQAQQDAIELIEPPQEEPLDQKIETVAPMPATPEFETLEEAVKSPESTIAQIRDLVVKEGFVVAPSIRPHLWCKVICGKTLDETLKSSVADSFQQWEKNWLKIQEEKKAKQEEQNKIMAAKEEAARAEKEEEKKHSEQKEPENPQDDSKEPEETKDAGKEQESRGKEDEQNTAKEQEETKEAVKEQEAGEKTEAPTKQLETVDQAQPEQSEQDWIETVSDTLADRIATELNSDKESSRQALIAILHNHYDDGAPSRTQTSQDKSGQEQGNDQTEGSAEDSDKNDGGKNEKAPLSITDPLLPPVASALLSAGVPKVAASVMLSKIVPNFMPILGLTQKERTKAADILHSQFYLLACYHLPCLAIHLDRYIPDWYKATPVGIVPQSWLVSHLAGDCDGSSMNPRQLHCLWDLVLTSSNNSLRFFLSMALLQLHAAKLVLLTGEELSTEMKKVLSFDEKALHDAESEEASNDHAVQWVHEWSNRAQALWEATPICIVRQLKKLEDDAVNDALVQRQQEIEKRLQARLEAEAKKQQELAELEREKKAEEARLRLTRARLVAYYRQYNPEKEGNIEKLMELYKGRYEVLDAKLKKKYGVGFNPPLKPVSPTKRSENTGAGGGGGGFGELFGGKKQDTDGDESIHLRDLVLEVQAGEAVSGVCWSKSAHRSKVLNIKEASKLEHERDGLLPLKFYVVDSRPKEVAESQGRFPTSINLSPETFLDPDSLAEQVKILESLRGMAHICIMGEGYSALPELYGHRMTKRLSACIGEDDSRNRNCALFLLKLGLPFVSIVDGGFASMHAFLCREGPDINLDPQLVLADYNSEVSVFGQFEAIYSSSGRQKAQRRLQNLFDNSMAAITLNTMRLEKAMSPEAANDPPASGTPTGGQNVVSRFFSQNTTEKGGSGAKVDKPIFGRRDSANSGDTETDKPLFGGFSVNFGKDEESLLSRNPFSMFGNNSDKKKPSEKGSMAGHFAGFKNKMERMKDEVLNESKPEKPKQPTPIKRATVGAIPPKPAPALNPKDAPNSKK